MNIVIIVILLLAGIIILFGSIFNWDWMFRSSLARNLIQATGVDKAKIIYGVVGMLLLVLAATLILVPQFNAPLQGKPNATIILKVGSDGCTVTRTDAVGPTSLEHFQWVVSNKDFQTMFTRSADDEHEFRYNETGAYDIVVQAWYKGAYVTVSNKVKIDCAFQ